MLQLPAQLTLNDAPQLWLSLQASLMTEVQQVRTAAGQGVDLSAARLQEFDSAALTVLLSAARLCQSQGVQLRVHEAPAKLQELARVYGVDGLIWPVPPAA